MHGARKEKKKSEGNCWGGGVVDWVYVGVESKMGVGRGRRSGDR